VKCKYQYQWTIWTVFPNCLFCKCWQCTYCLTKIFVTESLIARAKLSIRLSTCTLHCKKSWENFEKKVNILPKMFSTWVFISTLANYHRCFKTNTHFEAIWGKIHIFYRNLLTIVPVWELSKRTLIISQVWCLSCLTLVFIVCVCATYFDCVSRRCRRQLARPYLSLID